MVHDLFSYTVITQDGVVLLGYVPWPDVQDLCDLIEKEPLAFDVDHDEPWETVVTVPSLDAETIQMLHFRELVKRAFLEH